MIAQPLDMFGHHVLVDSRHRLVFFSIPKVACTQWAQLFRRLQGAPDWRDDPHHHDDRPYLSSLLPDECARILDDPDWIKAAFFRDPVERLISAYLDKFVYRKSYILEQVGFGDRIPSFEEFLAFVLDPNQDPARPEGLHGGTNPHWRPQSMLGGLGEYAGQLGFLGRFAQLQRDARALLQQLDLWSDYGESGWGPDGSAAIFAVNDADNRTDAHGQVERFLAPQQLDQVRQAYHMDYALFESLGLSELATAR